HPLPSLSDQAAISLYRILQEALTNAIKHAAANSVTVSLKHEDERIELVITDDGQGFEQGSDAMPSESGLGLTGMLERAEMLGGVLHIDSQPGKGTRIIADIPYQHTGEES
ncbi:MAG: ATP-binding protein, partial [Candidatus Promineifilaceae bacterium]|nr:ATP-binding protein [Candidatus Promineifilaceae bacterium]